MKPEAPTLNPTLCRRAPSSEPSSQVQSAEWVQYIGVVVKIMVPFGVPNIVRHLIFGVPKKGP